MGYTAVAQKSMIKWRVVDGDCNRFFSSRNKKKSKTKRSRTTVRHAHLFHERGVKIEDAQGVNGATGITAERDAGDIPPTALAPESKQEGEQPSLANGHEGGEEPLRRKRPMSHRVSQRIRREEPFLLNCQVVLRRPGKPTVPMC